MIARPDIPSCTATGPLTPDGLPWPLDERWRTETVVGLAAGIREDRAFERLPILADALEEAGCDEELVLLHCRECANHVPDCWVVSFCLEGDPLVRPAAVAERLELDRQRWLAWETAKAAGWQPRQSSLEKWVMRLAVAVFTVAILWLVIDVLRHL